MCGEILVRSSSSRGREGNVKYIWYFIMATRGKFLAKISRQNFAAHCLEPHFPQPFPHVCGGLWTTLIVTGKVLGLGPVSRKSLNFSGDTIIPFVFSKRKRLETRHFAVIFTFYSLYNLWKDKLYRISRSEVLQIAFRARKFFGTFEKRASGLRKSRLLHMRFSIQLQKQREKQSDIFISVC